MERGSSPGWSHHEAQRFLPQRSVAFLTSSTDCRLCKQVKPMLLSSQEYMRRSVMFFRLASTEPQLEEKQRLLACAKRAKDFAKLARMVERRGCAKPVGK